MPATVAYTVVPGDTLWDIARDRLGDPLRWPVVYRLNRDRIQPDGLRLRDPELIRPGWILHLPVPKDTGSSYSEPAHSHPVSPMPNHRTGPVQLPAKAPQADVAAPPAGDTAQPRPDQRPATAVPAPHTRRPAVDIGVGDASAIGVTTAAGIAAAVRFSRAHARRRRQPDLAAAAPPPLAHAVRAANSAHLTTRQQQEKPTGQDETSLSRDPAPAEPMALATVVCATVDGRELAVDALAVPGGIALTGPGTDPAARALAIAVLSAAERQRPGQPKVQLLTPTETAERLLPPADHALPAWTVPRDCGEALALVDQRLLHHARLSDGDDGTADELPMYVLLTNHDPRYAERLKATARQAGPGKLAVVVLHSEDWPSRIHLAVDGTVLNSTGLTAQPLSAARMFTLAPEPAHELLDILYAAHDLTTPATTRSQPPPPIPTSVSSPHRPLITRTPEPKKDGAHTNPQPSGEIEAKGAGTENSAKEQPSAPVTVHVLGRFRIRARGKDEEFGHGLRPETREFLCLLATEVFSVK